MHTKGGKNMARHGFSISPEELDKLAQIEAIRADLRGYNPSKKVHVIMQEWFRNQLAHAQEKGLKIPALTSRTKGPQCRMAYFSIETPKQQTKGVYIALKGLRFTLIKSDASLPENKSGGGKHENKSESSDQSQPEEPFYQPR